MASCSIALACVACGRVDGGGGGSEAVHAPCGARHGPQSQASQAEPAVASAILAVAPPLPAPALAPKPAPHTSPAPREAPLVWRDWRPGPPATPQPIASIGRSCRASGGSWVAAWVACRCPHAQAFVGGAGCRDVAPPRPLEPALPPQPWAWPPRAVLHLGSRASPAPAIAMPAAAGDARPSQLWPPPALPQHTWHAGRATRDTRQLLGALRRRRWPEAFGTTPELGGSAALGVSYLDAAARTRWWPELGPDNWASGGEHATAWAVWAAAPTSPQRLRQACRRLARSLQHARDGDGDNDDDGALAAAAPQVAAACLALRFVPQRGAPPRPRRARLALATRLGGPAAWRLVQSATAAPLHVSGTTHARWEVLGVGGAVLQRRLAVPLGARATLLIFFDADGRGQAFALRVGGRPWLWYDAQGRATRPSKGHALNATKRTPRRSPTAYRGARMPPDFGRAP